MQPHEKTFRNVLESSVRREIIDAARAVSAHLTASGIRHAIVGALAIGVYGCTKLFRHASRDRTDIIEMIKAGLVELPPIRAYLTEHTPVFLRRWDELVADAADELARGV